MKRLGIGLIIVAGLIVAALFILPAIIPASAYKDRVEQAASQALSRDVVLAGDVSLTLFPRVQVQADNVSIANADGFGEDAFAQMRQMRVGVELLPLLSRRVEITEFVLVEPVIRLEQRGGANNWTFAAEDAEPAPASSSSGGFVRQPGALPIEASFGDVRIENAAIYFSDGVQSQEITGLNLAIALPSLDTETRIDGSLAANGEALEFDARLGSIRDFFEGRATPLVLNLGGRLIDLGFDGEIPEGEAIALAGAISADIPDIRALAAFAGAELPPGENLERFSTSGRISGTTSRLELTADSLRLDDITGSGGLAADLSGSKPRITGSLDLPALDVTPYLPEAADEAPSSGGGVPPWSEEPIDLAGLGVVNALLELTVGQLTYRDLEVSDAALNVALENSRLVARLQRISLYEGAGTVTVVANARSATPSFSLEASLTGLDAYPFLEAAAGFDRLQGTGSMALNFSATGNSQAAIMNSLDGNGNFNFADGAIVGINIAQTIRNVSSFLNRNNAADAETSNEDSEAAETGETQTTDFTSLGGTFTIVDGQLSNQDLLMLSPLLRVEGLGTVNLAGQSLDYRLRPRAVASIEGQGGASDLQGVIVPIRIRGGFNSVSIGVDTEAVGQALLQGALRNAVGGNGSQSLEDTARDALRNAIGLGSPDSQTDDASDEEPQADPAQQLLQGLLNSRRSRDTQQQDEETTDDPN
ncbi:AsmA family protein [Maricaulis parjimensis]|uniref:AsmA family protein n=1 Tax=Maricaulis parjimensis TaxID=144023 RepID=UPI00193A7865|nr:AsmA family protein [Maricaulis parjimensis]